MLYVLLFYLSFLAATASRADDSNSLYKQAINVLDRLDNPYDNLKPLYTQKNISESLYIPPYDSINCDYKQSFKIQNLRLENEVIPLLEQAAEDDHVASMLMLADFYTFGNYSAQTNYSKGLDYYHRVVNLSPIGHAYFMLGVLYSTGGIGEFDIDQEKATLYFKAGADNDDFNSILAMANRYDKGIGVKYDCDLTLNYYERASQIGFDYVQSIGDNLYSYTRNYSYDFKISDFKGGIYGKNIWSSPSTTNSKNDIRNYLDAYDYEYDIDLAATFIELTEKYYGTYFESKNYSQAFALAEECVSYSNYFEFNLHDTYSNIDLYFLTRCEAILGEMYLKGLGTKADYQLAFDYLKSSMHLINTTADALLNIGYMYENGLVPNEEERSIEKALAYYKVSKVSSDSHLIIFKLMDILVKSSNQTNLFLNPYRDEIYSAISREALKESPDPMIAYYYKEFLQSGIGGLINNKTNEDCYVKSIYSSIFAHSLELIPFGVNLREAFEDLLHGQYKNALLKYSIAAEQGYINAHMSAAYLLYQTEPLFTRKERKMYTEKRIKLAMRYLEVASKSEDIEASLMLGELFLHGIDGIIKKNPTEAFKYFSKSASQGSSFGYFMLGNMFEYGNTEDNNTDYFLAKRFYDSSLRAITSSPSLLLPDNSIPIHLALFRLRIKYFFKRRIKGASIFRKLRIFDQEDEAYGYQKHIGIDTSSEPRVINNVRQKSEDQNRMNDKNNAPDADPNNFIGISFTLLLCIALATFYLLQYWAENRAQNLNNPNNAEEQNQRQQPQNGWNRNGFHFQQGNFEFHFIAL